MHPIFFARHAERLVVALDVTDPLEALRVVEALRGTCQRFKVGLPLLATSGLALLDALHERGAEVFVDGGLAERPDLTYRTAALLTRPGVLLLGVHALAGAVVARAAQEGSREAAQRLGMEPPRVLGTLWRTPAGADWLEAAGCASWEEGTRRAAQVAALAEACEAAGLDGLVAPAHDLPAIRSATSPGFMVASPGIRPRGMAGDEHATPVTPTRALQGGAAMLVVGRPILNAQDPQAVTASILREMEEAFMIA